MIKMANKADRADKEDITDKRFINFKSLQTGMISNPFSLTRYSQNKGKNHFENSKRKLIPQEMNRALFSCVNRGLISRIAEKIVISSAFHRKSGIRTICFYS